MWINVLLIYHLIYITLYLTNYHLIYINITPPGITLRWQCRGWVLNLNTDYYILCQASLVAARDETAVRARVEAATRVNHFTHGLAVLQHVFLH